MNVFSFIRSVFVKDMIYPIQNLKIVWISSSFNINHLEGKVSKVFNRIGVGVKPDDIKACHRLSNDKKQLSNFQKENSVNKFCKLTKN